MKTIQIRKGSDLHRQLKARAAMEGTSQSEYALAELRVAMERPTRAEQVEIDGLGRQHEPFGRA